MRATCARQSFASSRSRLASATVQASALPMNVGPCMSTPDSEAEMPRATSSVQSAAARVR